MLNEDREGSVRSIGYRDLERGSLSGFVNQGQLGAEMHRISAQNAAYFISQSEHSRILPDMLMPSSSADVVRPFGENPFIDFDRTDSELSEKESIELSDVNLFDDNPAVLEIRPSETATIVRRGKPLAFSSFRD